MYVLVTDRGVYMGRTVKAVAKASGLGVRPEDFVLRGRHHVAVVGDRQSLEVLADVRRIEAAAFGKLWRPDPLSFSSLLEIGQLLLLLVLLMRG